MGVNPNQTMGGHYLFRSAASLESRASPKKADERGGGGGTPTHTHTHTHTQTHTHTHKGKEKGPHRASGELT